VFSTISKWVNECLIRRVICFAVLQFALSLSLRAQPSMGVRFILRRGRLLVVKQHSQDPSLAVKQHSQDQSLAVKQLSRDQSLAVKQHSRDQSLAVKQLSRDQSLAVKQHSPDRLPVVKQHSPDQLLAAKRPRRKHSSSPAALLAQAIVFFHSSLASAAG
jgi:hypothetical protein